MALRLPLGASDFAQLRRAGSYYVDKSGLAVELIRSSASVVLLPRPRRFGKTLNLSMLRYWFERPLAPGGTDIPGVFAGLDVAAAGEDVAARFQRHPVIFLTFKDVKNKTWETCRENVLGLLQDEVVRLRPAWADAPLADHDRHLLEALAVGTASDAVMQSALRVLCRAIALGTGEDAVLLIDEYDTPIHSGWIHGYYDDVIELLRNLLSGGLKDNPHIYRGVITGILRVAKASIFSGLNNVSVHTMLSGPFSRWFGFTDAEVDELCRLAGPEANREGIRQWYNGYLMGGQVVYNPWSVLSYLAAISDGFKPYWVNTASDEILRRLLIGAGLGIQAELAALVAGGDQAFLVGLLVQLDATHVVDANREAGFGRYDVCVRPRLPAGAHLSSAMGTAAGSPVGAHLSPTAGRSGAVLELKVVDPNRETWETALESAMRQIHDRAYASALHEAGADPVWLWAAVFDGKRVRVKVERG